MDWSRIALHEMDPQGCTFSVSEERVWTEPLRKYRVPCRIVEPVRAEVFAFAQKEGCLLRGTIMGTVTLPCDRCAEEAHIVLNQSFDEFEGYPNVESDDSAKELLEKSVITVEGGVPFLDLEAFLWEEFFLALPMKPLCRPDCKGLCPKCGKNLNEGPCACAHKEEDPRFAALRQLRIH